jgi:hypothetical protein
MNGSAATQHMVERVLKGAALSCLTEEPTIGDGASLLL